MLNGFRSKIGELHPRIFFLETWMTIDREAQQERASSIGYDYKPLICSVVGAACLAIMEYAGYASQLGKLLQALFPCNATEPNCIVDRYYQSHFLALYQHGWWAFWRITGYFVIPALVIKFLFKQRLRDYGLSTVGFREHFWIYLIFFFPVFILVILASFRSDFLNYYPFYEQADRSWGDFLIWEVLYGAQFFALEFFFRGFWLKACKESLGSHAIFAMVVPYCMIHFTKPIPEVFAAIIAGIVLGTLALKTRSIWSGFLIHLSVAVSMDVAALVQKGAFPRGWWPG